MNQRDHEKKGLSKNMKKPELWPLTVTLTVINGMIILFPATGHGYRSLEWVAWQRS